MPRIKHISSSWFKFCETAFGVLIVAGLLSTGARATAEKIELQDSGTKGGLQKRQSDPEIWRATNRCSINSLYLILRLYDIDVTYEEVESRLPIDEAGSSLAEMRECATSFGLNATILKASPESLVQCPFPCIAHEEMDRTITGHYVVVVEAQPQMVEVIDGSSVITKRLRMPEFKKDWTGYVLVFEKRPWWTVLYPVAMVLGIASIGLTMWSRRDSFRQRETNTENSTNDRTQSTSGAGTIA